jgi:glycosyltransferase involved in cell wall biosynthesis
VSDARPGSSDAAVFGFVLIGGALSGALVRDMRLANELARRGWRVHVWWAMDREKRPPLRDDIAQSWLFHGMRYLLSEGSDLTERAGRLLTRLSRDKSRRRFMQRRPRLIRRVMEGLITRVCEGVERDPAVPRRFAAGLSAAGVTHVLPMLAILCPWVQAARRLMERPPRYAVTFQGEELYGNYARALGRESDLSGRFVEAVEQSDWPAIAVSEDYARRVAADFGVPPERLRAIPPGIPHQVTIDRARAAQLIAERFPGYRADVPLVTFVGRRDVEKGIDLLLYAASILRSRGVELQLAVCGPTLFGDAYAGVCQQIAQDLRCPVLWSNQITDELRTALFTASRCIAYPSIHREPFGMVPVEALAHGTPAVVPDYGGIASAIRADGVAGGLHFRAWDSADLAEQIARLLLDDDLHRRLAGAGPGVAAYYSVEKLADRVLAHLGLPATPGRDSTPAGVLPPGLGA